MDRSFIAKMRENHAAFYAEKGNIKRAEEIATAKDQYSPIFKPRGIHPEEEPSVEEINMFITDIGHDLTILNHELAVAGDKFKNLMEDTKLRLEKVQRDIAIEEERLKDLNMLCGDHSEFDTVETLTFNDFEGAASDIEGVFHAKPIEDAEAKLYVMDVKGNGYEGNDFVYKNKRFVANHMFTGDRRYLTDRSLGTVYEYSRINVDKTEENVFALVNFDDIEAECTITLRANAPISSLRVLTEMKNIILKEVSVSDDGAIFRPVTEEAIAFNDKENIYRNGLYIFGSGIICFPSSLYVKLTFQSDGHTDDKIAFIYQNAKL